MFHDPPVKAPALILASRNDPICSFREMMGVVDGWRDQGVPVSNAGLQVETINFQLKNKRVILKVKIFPRVQISMKIWDDSPHVGHMRKHRKEYIGELNSFLEGLNLPGVHDSEGDKITSKLWIKTFFSPKWCNLKIDKISSILRTDLSKDTALDQFNFYLFCIFLFYFLFGLLMPFVFNNHVNLPKWVQKISCTKMIFFCKKI